MPLSRHRAQAEMEVACRRGDERLCFRSLRISRAVAVMVLDSAFYSWDPDGMGGAINILLFPDLSPSAGSEADLLARRWDANLGEGALTSF